MIENASELLEAGRDDHDGYAVRDLWMQLFEDAQEYRGDDRHATYDVSDPLITS